MGLDPVTIFLLALAAIFLIGTIGEIVFQKTGVPDVIWLIVAGVGLGPVSGLLTREDLSALAPYFAAITLVIVLFEGGSSLKLSEVSQAAPRSALLSLLAFGFAVMAVTLMTMFGAWVGWLPASWTWTHGIMTGAILGGTSSVVVMPAMAQAKLPPALSNLVNLESALTDAFCVVGTAAIIDVMTKDAGEAASPGVALLKSFGIGLAVGGIAGIVWLLFLRSLKSNEHAYPITLAVLLILYVVIDHMGGSAALGILTTAIILGNARSLTTKIGLAEPAELDKNVRGYHRQMAFMIKSFFFVFIGAMLGPPLSLIVLGVLIGLMLLSARIPSVYAATLGTSFTEPEKQMIVVCLPRGMAAGVLATLPVAAGVEGTSELPVLVFAAVVTTIVAFAIGFPLVKRAIPAVASATTDVRVGPSGAALLVAAGGDDGGAAGTEAAVETPGGSGSNRPADAVSGGSSESGRAVPSDGSVSAGASSAPGEPTSSDGPVRSPPEVVPWGYADGSPPEDREVPGRGELPLPTHPADVPAYRPGAFEAIGPPVKVPDPPSSPGLLNPSGDDEPER